MFTSINVVVLFHSPKTGRSIAVAFQDMMESLSADTIPAGVPEDTAGAAFSGPDAGGAGAFCCAPGAGAFTASFPAGFVPAFGAGFDAVFVVYFGACFYGAGFVGSGAAAASISRRLHSGMWADALQERSRGYTSENAAGGIMKIRLS